MTKDLDAAAEQMEQLAAILHRMESLVPVSRSSHLTIWMSMGTMSGMLGVSHFDILSETEARGQSFLESILSLFRRKPPKEDRDALLLDLWKRGHSKLTVLGHLFRTLGDPKRQSDFERARKYVKDYLDLAAFVLD